MKHDLTLFPTYAAHIREVVRRAPLAMREVRGVVGDYFVVRSVPEGYVRLCTLRVDGVEHHFVYRPAAREKDGGPEQSLG